MTNGEWLEMGLEKASDDGRDGDADDIRAEIGASAPEWLEAERQAAR